MMRTSKPKLNVVLAGAAIAVSLEFLACSSPDARTLTGSNTNPGTDTTHGSNDTNGSTSSSGSSSGATPSGSTSGGSSGGTPSTSSSSGGSSSGAVADSGTGNSVTNNGVGIPTAPGITVGPVGATDLAPPDPSVGVQYETPDNAYAVEPNQEIFPNFCVTVPKAIQVGGFQSWMSIGSSHHFILYKGGQAASAGGACTTGANTWMYASSTPGQVVTENMPANVGLAVDAGTQLIVNMHFINPGTTTLHPKVKVNLLFTTDFKYAAGTMYSFNTQINIPPATAAGPGIQTVGGTCTAPTGAQFFTMSTHTHKHATAAWVDFVHNGASQEIVHTGPATTYPPNQEQGSGLDWEHPGVGLWTAPNFLTIAPGDSFDYHCSYSNSASTSVTVGETAASNEMCMAVGYYFPAGKSSCN